MNLIPRLGQELLILRCQAGDENAFEQIVRHYHNPLRYFVRRLIGDSFRADDIVQEVWLSVYRNLEKRRVTRMKWAAAISWIFLALVYVLAGILGSPGIGQSLTSVPSGKVPPTPYLPVIAIIVWWIAIICTASLVVRIFRLRGFHQRQILDTLARIEEHLKQLDERK